ncbi:MAG: carboxypeptidase regulatory-like domain-containing protein [Acidobacteria bacterium]|nr:carboxypeptidase regulatory-like domain-containing protein [Acidobacteriota bacterium]
MKRFALTCLVALAALSWSNTAMAQGVQTGIIQGTVRDTGNLVLPGVTVTVASSALQGTRTTVTDGNGVYVLRGLPPGIYTVLFELAGFEPLERTTTVELGKPSDVSAALGVGGLTETVEVTASTVASTVTATTTGQNLRYEEINSLPAARTLQGVATLAPGLTTNTPNAGQVTISGAFAYDNVFLVDGVDINDNLFGTANNLFIEDAIEETQVLTSGISAEYGRFSGGVVNAVTKSGGDLFSGSFRANLTNDKWQRQSPFEKVRDIERNDKLNQVYEATTGGPILRTKLWFFGAGRWLSTETEATLPTSGVPFTSTNEEKRGEIKLTGTVAQNHTFTGSYFKLARDAKRVAFGFSIDPKVAEEPSFPNDRWVAGYRGVLGSRAFAEARWSRKSFGFRNTGGTSTSIVDSPFIGLSQLVHFNAPYFDATDPEDRNNYQLAGSLSYFLTTTNAGSHDFKGGVEIYNSTRTGGNSQSPTNYVFIADYATNAAGQPLFDANGFFIPVFEPFASEYELWLATRGAQIDIKTTSFYLQDRWQAGRNLSFDLGVRYEKVRGEATGDIVTVDTDTWVPRLAASYDLKGDGRYVAQATYAWYSGKYSEAQFASNTDVGNPAGVFAYYVGPEGQGRDFAPGFDPDNYVIYTGSFPTANVFFDSGLSSPVTKEITLSLGGQFGRGYVKGTYVQRSMSNFVEDFYTLDGGRTTVTRDGITFGTFTNQIYRNSDDPKRDYKALQFIGRYPITARWSVTGNYTLQIENDGNFEGEGTNTPGISSVFGDYPEAFNESRHYPDGRLNDFQRHKVRLWTTYNTNLPFRLGNADLSLLYRYDSPLSYSLAASNVPLSAVQRNLLAAYASRPSNQTLYFGDRGSELFDAAHLFDFGLNYEVPVFKSLRPYLKFDVFNVFNHRKLVTWNTVVRADNTSALDGLGLPTGYTLGPLYGQATSTANYATARRWQIAMGFRF